ncbi:SH3 domain-containing protein [Roseofilum capinflatum]|uniref:SH3 domain-containing protein n=1 Tax=Roseofilum capinflatum BLCC-M114 TaxID=3022440 RepID=A0ABT7B7X1_9CYAN|nr:SH3 domain-containing protein [Roseofilum capinflatum]MDJ1175275.1 SH3 domain-containing protein [Roseofilum capinflatum BLCC-M114]
MVGRLVSGFFQVIFGVTLAIALMLVGGLATARYFMAKMTIDPPKPEFPEAEEAKPASAPLSTPAEAQKPKEPELPEGAYKARVTWPDGLILRDAPTYEANSIGGVGYNETLYVIGESEDQVWDKVRIGSQDAWVKGGNVEKVE